MKIENHRLVATSPDELVSFQFDEALQPLLPEIAVVHYAVAQSAGETAGALKAKDYLSCHVTIDRNGIVIQQVPFNRRAYHAGESSYRGRVSCNQFSLGIEIANPGPVFKQPDGSFVDVYKRPWRGEVIEARHELPGINWTHWAAFSEMELDLCAQICDLWRAEYGIRDVVGHSDVATPRGRKADPGPAFPIEWLRSAVFGGGGAA